MTICFFQNYLFKKPPFRLKKRPNHMLLHLSYKDKDRLQFKGQKMIVQAHGIQRKVGVVILILDKIDTKIKVDI